MEILDIFYDEFLEEAANGEVDCELILRLLFNTLIIEDNKFIKVNKSFPNTIVPTLIIDDKKKFNTCLLDYIIKAMAFYKDKRLDYVNKPIKYLIGCATANMTTLDYINPSDYFKRLSSFLTDNTLQKYELRTHLGYSSILDAEIEVQIEKEPIHEEAPYSAQFFLTSKYNDEICEFQFQKIRFGIDNGTAYIFAIQHAQKENAQKSEAQNTFLKKIKRKNYKANAEVDSNDAIHNANPSAVMALTLFISLLRNHGITKIMASNFLIQRWNDKIIKFQKLEEDYRQRVLNDPLLPDLITIRKNEALITRYKKALEEQQTHSERTENISQKFINCFSRMSFHFPEIESQLINAAPSSIVFLDTSMMQRSSNALLDELHSIIEKNNYRF